MDKRFTTYVTHSESNWIEANHSEKPGKQKEECIKTILDRAEQNFSHANVDVVEFEERCMNKPFAYCEQKVLLGVTAFHPLFTVKSKRKTPECEAIFPVTYPFNINKAGTRHELLAQLWGYEHGYTDPWLYVKSPESGTILHDDVMGSVNIFGGHGTSNWTFVPSTDYWKCRALYNSKCDSNQHIFQGRLRV